MEKEAVEKLREDRGKANHMFTCIFLNIGFLLTVT